MSLPHGSERFCKPRAKTNGCRRTLCLSLFEESRDRPHRILVVKTLRLGIKQCIIVQGEHSPRATRLENTICRPLEKNTFKTLINRRFLEGFSSTDPSEVFVRFPKSWNSSATTVLSPHNNIISWEEVQIDNFQDSSHVKPVQAARALHVN